MKVPNARPFFQPHADKVTCRKSAGIANIGCHAVQVLNKLPDNHDPDQDLEEPKQWSQVAPATRNEDDAQRSQGHIADASQEDQGGENDPRIPVKRAGCGKKNLSIAYFLLRQATGAPLVRPIQDRSSIEPKCFLKMR